MHHPLVCANLIDMRGRPLAVRSELDLEHDGQRRVRRRVFGLLVVQYPEGSPWERIFGWRFFDPCEAAAAIARRRRRDAVLIALSHLGLRPIARWPRPSRGWI